MGYWLARERTVQVEDVLTRFDARFWTVNFPRPMTASVTTIAPDGLRVDLSFYRKDDLCGLIWESEDRWDHALLSYATRRDYRGCRLSFRWRSSAVATLDSVHGPVLTIEGRDGLGNPRSWYVRLWNYAQGTGTDATVTIDFMTVAGGFLHPAEADPVWAADVDRMFVSIVPPDHDGTDAPLDAPVDGWVEMTGIRCTGPDCVLSVGDAMVPEHGLSIASGYDDSYHLTPARLLRNMLQLGYRGDIVHYVGMSHYFRLESMGGAYLAATSGDVLGTPCVAWHRDFAERAAALGFGVIWSLSYELLARHCPQSWQQRAADGAFARTGWDPPSALLSPAHGDAMAYLADVARAFVGIGAAAGLSVRFQIGEPWWWVMADGRLCIHDDAARAALDDPPEQNLRGVPDPVVLDAAGAVLAASTHGLRDAVRAAAPGAEVLLLVYLPTVLDTAMPEARRVNMPVGWARPAFDLLQLEDYDWAAAGRVTATARAMAAVEARLGYPVWEQHYFSGFVLRPDEGAQWPFLDAAAQAARARGVAATFLWAMPQVIRDGFVHFDQESDVQPFDDILFPLSLGENVEVSPQLSTAIITSAGGHERRNAEWEQARTSYDVGPGVRSESDMATLLGFFRARMGPARGFRLNDPFDNCSREDGAPSPLDQRIGTGDGGEQRFALVKHYGDTQRRITRPVAGSVRVALNGVETAAFAVEEAGWVVLDTPPDIGAAVTAGYRFDVPVRFSGDSITINRATFRAGEAPSVPLLELRED